MRSALVDKKLDKQSTYTTHTSTSPMPHFSSHSSPAPMRSPMNPELASFKKSIKREASAYSVLKDELFLDKFQRDLFITAKSHDVSEILEPTFTPGPSPEEKELFEAKQDFMYKVFNEALLTDMGRTKVRKYLKPTDVQAVWKEYSEHKTTSSKGASEKRKLTHYVTNTVLNSQFRGLLSNLSCTSMSNSGDWMKSLTYLRECQTPSRWHSFRMLSRTFPSSVLLKLWMNTLPRPLGWVIHSPQLLILLQPPHQCLC